MVTHVSINVLLSSECSLTHTLHWYGLSVAVLLPLISILSSTRVLLLSSSATLASVTSSSPVLQLLLQPLLSCANWYHLLSSILNFFKSFLTRSRHLILVPCAGRCWGSQPNSIFLGSLRSSILARWPSHLSRLAITISSRDSSIPNWQATWTLLMCSVQYIYYY